MLMCNYITELFFMDGIYLVLELDIRLYYAQFFKLTFAFKYYLDVLFYTLAYSLKVDWISSGILKPSVQWSTLRRQNKFQR